MNQQLVQNILGVIKTSSDKAVVVKALLKLRTDLVKDKDGIILFRQAGGVPPMVRLLSKPHEQILEVVLSILGNCCTDELCCKEAFEHKCVSFLATILKSIPNPLIQCRACRLLGNLAKCDREELLATHCQTIAQSLCQVIVDTKDLQTRMMAFRGCRLLLVNAQFFKHFLQSNGFATLLRILATIMKQDVQVQTEQLLKDAQQPPVIGLKQTQHREMYFEEVARNLEGIRNDIFEHEVLSHPPRTCFNEYVMPKDKVTSDLSLEILKCLLIMSEMQISGPVWESLQRWVCTFAPIVYFVVAEEGKQRSVALKILSNFAKNRGAFGILSSSDAIVAICETLVSSRADRVLLESEQRHCIIIICALGADACNRAKIRRSGALRKLIAIIRESQSQTEVSLILYLLNFFEYHNVSMELMLREGLISVLIKELDCYLTSDDEYYKKRREERQQNSKKRKLPEHANESSACKFAKMREDPLFDCESPSSSPRSYISPESPCSSRGMSPVGHTSFKPVADDAIHDDETYSPVCSDDEDEVTPNQVLSETTNEPATAPVDNMDIMKLLDIAGRTESIDDDVSDKEDEDEISRGRSNQVGVNQDVPGPKLAHGNNLSSGSLGSIENLLFRATIAENKRGELAKPETMKTLIKAINIFGANNNFAGALTNILLESQFFAQVVVQGIPHQLFQLTKLPEMRKDGFAFLETLTCVGESNYGKAELARFLRCDNEAAQRRATITVAYIIKSHRLLYQFLHDGGALALLFNTILRSEKDEYTAEAVDALTAMSRYTLGICTPQIAAKEQEKQKQKQKEKDCLNNSQQNQEYVESRFDELYAEVSTHISDMRFMVQESPHDTAMAHAPVAVPFSKQLLCDSSEVFNIMLTSDFREGIEGEIHLQTCTVSGLKYFLNFIMRQSNGLRPLLPSKAQYHVLLESFEMSRIYIIPAMEEVLLELLINQLDADNCLSVLECSIKNHHPELMETAINYYLCAELSVEDKVTMFRTANNSVYSAEWYQMLVDAVLLRCRHLAAQLKVERTGLVAEF